MAKKSLGYTKLVWTCPNCKTRNPGPVKTCQSCGSPQPKDVQFEQASQDELLKDEQEIRKAKSGADIHCPYCGTRNPAGAKTCSQCMGDLSGGSQRKSGEVIGAYRKEKAAALACSACGALNDADAPKCKQCGAPLGEKSKPKPTSTERQPLSRQAKIGLAVLGLVLAGGMCFLFSRVFKTSTLSGTVQEVNWQRSVMVEQYQMIKQEAWWDEVPEGAESIVCEESYRYTSSEAVENSIEVCGTPYSVDQGSGYAEVVQDCEYRVYDDYCSYQVGGWAALDELSLTGSNLQAEWPSVAISENQRTGESTESYVIIFSSETGEKRYSTTDYDLFQRCVVGSQWDLTLDGFGNIVEISQ
jgi:ribosomal protein L40E